MVKRRPARLIAERKLLASFRRVDSQVDRLIDRLDTARLDAGEVEQRIDQLEQPQAIAVHDLKIAPLGDDRGRRRLAHQHIFERTEHQASAACGTRGSRWKRRWS